MDKAIENCIEEYFSKFLDELAEKVVPSERKNIFKAWDSYKRGEEIGKKKTKVVEDEIPKCSHILVSGPNNGKPCGKNTVDGSTCRMHKSKAVISPTRIITKHVALKKWWNPKTKYVFDKAADGTYLVVGKTTKISGGETCPLLPLNDKDLETCKNLGYDIDQNKLDNIQEKKKALSGESSILTLPPDNITIIEDEKSSESESEKSSESEYIIEDFNNENIPLISSDKTPELLELIENFLDVKKNPVVNLR